ncbi:MAG: hypothetical protein J7621_09450 [Niastella sp.]|nr:hypothetical protein [Niastella sp.]
MIRSNNQLIIWTIVAHFFIVIGAGHGVGIIGIIEISGLFNLGEARLHTSLLSPFKDSWHAVAISSLLGQIALVLSMLLKGENKKSKLALHITGLLFLWMSIYYFTNDAALHSGIHISALFCLPLLILTLVPFFLVITRRSLS